jgi:nucleotide-binding universal stress UspA family protein
VADRLLSGSPAVVTCTFLRKTRSVVCNIIVMGTRAPGLIDRLFRGSVLDSVLRSSHVPVLTVRTTDLLDVFPLGSALVGVDDSAPSDAALAVAAILALDMGTALTACNVFSSAATYYDAGGVGVEFTALEDELREEARAVVLHALSCAALPERPTIEVVDGEPAAGLISVANSHHVTLIIVGTHGRRGAAHLLLGSVAERLVRTSNIPVLIVPAIRQLDAHSVADASPDAS